MIVQIFIATLEYAILTGTQANEANAEIKTQLVIVGVIVQHNLNACMSYIFHSLNHYVFFLLKDNFLFDQFFLI